MAGSRERVRVAGRELTLTNLDKIIYPETGTTKADVLAYYAAVAHVLIPAAANRPATRKRWVNGVGTADKPGEVFFQKDLEDSAPGWLPRGPSRFVGLQGSTFCTIAAQPAPALDAPLGDLRDARWSVDEPGRRAGEQLGHADDTVHRRTAWFWPLALNVITGRR